MNEYFNKRTGAYIRTECEISGDDWEKIEPKKVEEPKKAPKRKTAGRVKK